MPFPPALSSEEANSAFVGIFEAYLAAGNSPAFGDDFPTIAATWPGEIGDADLSAAGSLFAGAEFPNTARVFLGGFLGYVGGVGGTDATLPPLPVPDYGPIRPNQGAFAPYFPPALDLDEADAQFIGTFEGYLVAQAERFQTWSSYDGQIATDLAAGLLGQNQGNDPTESQILPSYGGQVASDLAAGPLGQNQENDPTGSQAQLDGQFDVFVGQIQPPFTTTRLPRLAFGPFINLSGLTYQIELDAFAKFGLAQIQYRIYANDQATPPYNVINLAGQASYTTSLILTLDSAAATLHADSLLSDSFGNVASQAASLPGVPDIIPPTAPPFLYVVELPDGSWLFAWGAASDDYLVGHYQIDQVDQSGAPIATVASDVKQDSFRWVGAAAGNYYRVLAFDLAGNVSPSSPIAQGVASQVAQAQITDVLAEQVPGTATIQVGWSVAPAGTSCTAQIVDALDRPVGSPATSTTGQASLALPVTTSAGLYRVKVTSP